MTVPQRRSGWPRVHLAMGFVVAVAVYLAADRYATTEVAAFLKDRRQTLYAALVSVHITMLGFALATLTVVLGYAQSPRFQVLRDSPWFVALFGVFTAALRVLALAFAAALAGLLFDRDRGGLHGGGARPRGAPAVRAGEGRAGGDQRPVEAAGGLSPGRVGPAISPWQSPVRAPTRARRRRTRPCP